MNLKMRLKDEWKLGLSEGRAKGRDETMLSLIHTLQVQGQTQKQIVETIALMQKSSLTAAQHYYEQVAQPDNCGKK